MNENKIGLVQLKEGTDEKTWRKIEEFFIVKKLFISSVPKGIMVLDIDKAKELIRKEMQ
jgi:hypothetical protein